MTMTLAELPDEVREALFDLSGPKFKIVTFYMMTAEDPLLDAVKASQVGLSGLICMHRTQLNREVKELVADGWLEPGAAVNRITYYRLGPKIRAQGMSNVVAFPGARTA